MAKYIFVTGGVVSSVGKGIAVASIGTILKCRKLSVSLQKLDPYLNVEELAERLHGVHVEEDAFFLAEIAYFLDWLNGSNLVVGVHH